MIDYYNFFDNAPCNNEKSDKIDWPRHNNRDGDVPDEAALVDGGGVAGEVKVRRVGVQRSQNLKIKKH